MTPEEHAVENHAGTHARRVYVVMPTRDRVGYLTACLRTLAAQTYDRLTVVVVDDGSSDGTADAVRRDFPDVVLLEGDGELWWTGATDFGVRWVLDRCAEQDCVLTLNDDTRVGPGYVEALVCTLEAFGGLAIVGSVAVDARDGDTIADGGPRLRWTDAKGGSDNAGGSLAALRAGGVDAVYPDLLPGRGTLIPVACLRSVGSFDVARFPHYAADYEFSARAARGGYRLVMSYEAPVMSEVAATGVTTRRGRLPWTTFFSMFVSRRSPACLLYRWRFALRVAPPLLRPSFIVADTVRVVGGAVADQLGLRRRGPMQGGADADGS